MRAGQESAEAIVASESVAAIGHTRPTPPLSEMLARSLENGAGHAVMQKALSNRQLQRYGFILPWQDAAA